MILPLEQSLFLLTGWVSISYWGTLNRSLLVLHQSGVTFSSPDVTLLEYFVCFHYFWLSSVLSPPDWLHLSSARPGTMWDCRLERTMEEWRLYERGTAAVVPSPLQGVLTTEPLWARFTAASGTDCWTWAATLRERIKVLPFNQE